MTHFATAAVRSGIETDTQFGAVTPPIYLTSNYSFEGYNQPRQYDYARSGNPYPGKPGAGIGAIGAWGRCNGNGKRYGSGIFAFAIVGAG